MVARRAWRASRISLVFFAASTSIAVWAQPASAGWLWPDSPYDRGQFFQRQLPPHAVADILYSRYGMARVMSVRPRGDVYWADAIDRRGYRVRFTIDGFNGRVLESYVVGTGPYEAAVPVPPGAVPREARREDFFAPEPAPPPSNRRAMIPRDERELDPATPPRRNEKKKPPPKSQAARQPPTTPLQPPAPAAKPEEKLPETAARPAGPAEQPGPDKLDVAPPSPAPEPMKPTGSAPTVAPPRPAEKPAEPAPAARPAEARPSEPAKPAEAEPPKPDRPAARAEAAGTGSSKIPEPLIDPKTGRHNPSTIDVPPAPLDDAPSKRAAPSAPPPPVSLE
jgi:hypothetical protein